MDWHNEDPFDSILKEFFGQPKARRKSSERFTEGEQEDRTIDAIEADGALFLIFELPGFNAKDISIAVSDRRLEIHAQKKDTTAAQVYLHPRLQQGTLIKKTLSASINSKKVTHTYKNGILEVCFEKND